MLTNIFYYVILCRDPFSAHSTITAPGITCSYGGMELHNWNTYKMILFQNHEITRHFNNFTKTW